MKFVLKILKYLKMESQFFPKFFLASFSLSCFCDFSIKFKNLGPAFTVEAHYFFIFDKIYIFQFSQLFQEQVGHREAGSELWAEKPRCPELDFCEKSGARIVRGRSTSGLTSELSQPFSQKSTCSGTNWTTLKRERRGQETGTTWVLTTTAAVN